MVLSRMTLRRAWSYVFSNFNVTERVACDLLV